MADYRFDDLSVGMAARRRFEFSEARVQAFSELVDDWAPVHVDEDFALGQGYPGRIVHGLFVQAVISGMLGNDLPGPNTVINTVSMKMHGPVPVGGIVDYEIEILSLTPAVSAVSLGFSARIDDQVVMSGKALCSFPSSAAS